MQKYLGNRLNRFIQKPRYRQLQKELADFRRVKNELSTDGVGIVLRGSRIMIPSKLRIQMVDLAYVEHQGLVKTKVLIKSRVWFTRIDGMVENRVGQPVTKFMNL